MQWPFEITERDHHIQNPTNPEKIRQLGRYLRLDPTHLVLDVACGKGGPACILAAEFGCRILGVELSPVFADAARERVADAGLDELVEVRTADASTFEIEEGRYDAALCLGASFVWGHMGDAARALTRAVRHTGGVAIGEPFWRTWPLSASALAGVPPADPLRDPQLFVDLAGTVGRFEEAGLSLTGMIASSEDDWDHYESLHWRAIAEWLEEQPDHPDAGALRQGDAEVRSDYLSFQRGAFGWAIFVGRRP